MFHGNTNENKIYAINAHSKSKTQLVWIQLNEYDHSIDHFWMTFMTALAAWNFEFSLEQRQKSFPKTPGELKDLLTAFAGSLQENPLMIAVIHAEWITRATIQNFLKSLMELDGLSLILVYSEHQEANAPKDTYYNNLQMKQPYMTEEEEWLHYKKSLPFQLTGDEFSNIRYYTDGWTAAVGFMEMMLAEEGKKVFDNLPHYVNLWLDRQLFKLYNQPDLHRLICTTLLDEFPLELLQYLYNWNGEGLLNTVDDNPIVRYNPETKYYYYAKYIQPRLQERQVLLSNKDKQDFLIQVGDWFNERGKKVEAIHCYKKAGFVKKTLQVINQWEFPVSRETANCYVDTINELPAPVMDKNPILHVVRAHMLSTLYRYLDAYQLMEKFCAALDNGDKTPPKLRTVLGEAYILWANASFSMLRDEEETLTLFKKAAELLPNGSAMVQNKLNLFSDCPIIRLPNPKAGTLKKNLEFIVAVEPYLVKATGGGWSGCGYLATAEMNYYIRNFAEVETPARKAITAALQKDQHDLACSACFLLMRFNFAKGNYEKLMESYRLLKQLASEANYGSFFSMPDLAESWLHLKLGKRHQVADWIRDESHYQKKIKPWNYGRDRLIRAYYLLKEQQYDTVISYANSVIDLLARRGYNLLNIQLMMMKAVAYNELNEVEKSVEAFQEVYEWTHENNVVMPIVEFANSIRPIVENCRKVKDCAIPPEWLDEILKKSNSYYVYQYNIRKQYEQRQKTKTSLLEGLTGAEQKLLLMVSRGMTSKEIAETQGKTISSIKGMCRRVYIKIGANSKAEAVRVATENNIEGMVHLP